MCQCGYGGGQMEWFTMEVKKDVMFFVYNTFVNKL